MSSALAFVCNFMTAHRAGADIIVFKAFRNITAAYPYSVSIHIFLEHIAAAAGSAIAPCFATLLLVEQELRQRIIYDLVLGFPA